MEPFNFQSVNRYYAILGLNSDASPDAIRAAYKKLAMKWHPDKCNAKDRAKGNLKFQEIQEAYTVLSDERKKMLYDSGLYYPDDDEEDIEGLSSFLNEMTGMMANVQDSEKMNSLEDLQQLFAFHFDNNLDVSTCKKTKCAPNGLNSTACDNGLKNKGSKGMAALHSSACADGLHMNMHENSFARLHTVDV
ncbi:hypothetical protein GOP47_0024400 [Adiantum capillus-veneris]|uniref:J domain-containing protein n=1 Tax=Adiantum capillus-veneris TaxID=13818 RepID=A0A9D4Z3M4_ADICA|nr:hypothetical protein GOP47_0024400 [Adiantum capillus-veneris]